MTRRDYLALAKVVATLKDATERAAIAKAIGSIVAESNIHLDWSKWWELCGVGRREDSCSICGKAGHHTHECAW